MPLSWNDIKTRSLAFAKHWASANNENADAKPFLVDFFEIFGITNKRIASFEHAVTKYGGNRGYVDLFWPGILLVEMKSKGKSLDRAYNQAMDYFPGIKERDLPRYVLVCDFARFRLHDVTTNTVNEFALADLHQHVHLFGFIAGYQTQVILPQDPINIQAAERMGDLHDQMLAVGYEGHALELYLVRLLFCLFAQDTGIFQKRQLHEYIEQRTAEDGSDLASRLFELFYILSIATNKRLKKLDEQLAAFPYINGKLFEELLPPAAFDRAMRESLLDLCGLDWSRISPAIFGSLFQSIMDKQARRNLGAHYTSEENILKLIKPLFLDDLWAEFEKIKTNNHKLLEFHKKLRSLNFLDPACGCGNFLVITYRELRLLEFEVLRVIYPKWQLKLDIREVIAVDVDQLYGIEIEEFPAQIAQVALWLTDHQMNLKVSEEFGKYFVRIPLLTSANIVRGNALQLDWNGVLPAERCSYVLGNPPFVGHHLQNSAQKQNMLAAYGLYAKAAGVMDYVTAWYMLAAKYIKGTNIKVAFVSTNSLAQGEQVGILWGALLRTGPLYIHFAHHSFKWSNEARGKAAVYCVIIGFAGIEPKQCIIYEYDEPDGAYHAITAKQINAYLVDAPWILLENRSTNPFGMPEMMYGCKPTDGGNLLLTDEEKTQLLQVEPDAAMYIKPFISAHEYLHGENRWVIWLVNAIPQQLLTLPQIMRRVKAVDAFRKASKAASTRSYPYPTLFRQITQPTADFLLIPCTTSEDRQYIPLSFFGKDCVVGNTCHSIPNATLFHFGVMTSIMHNSWMRFVCGRHGTSYRYSKDIVYNNYPWPTITDKERTTIKKAAQWVLNARAMHPESNLSALYNPLTMPPNLLKAHQKLDHAVDTAYGYTGAPTDTARVAFLFELYQKLTSLLPAEKPVKKSRRKATSKGAI